MEDRNQRDSFSINTLWCQTAGQGFRFQLRVTPSPPPIFRTFFVFVSFCFSREWYQRHKAVCSNTIILCVIILGRRGRTATSQACSPLKCRQRHRPGHRGCFGSLTGNISPRRYRRPRKHATTSTSSSAYERRASSTFAFVTTFTSSTITTSIVPKGGTR